MNRLRIYRSEEIPNPWSESDDRCVETTLDDCRDYDWIRAEFDLNDAQQRKVSRLFDELPDNSGFDVTISIERESIAIRLEGFAIHVRHRLALIGAGQ
jgi:hypothetical protein